MKKIKAKKSYWIGMLSGANGHALFLSGWPNAWMDPERKEDNCTFCVSRGLTHGW